MITVDKKVLETAIKNVETSINATATINRYRDIAFLVKNDKLSVVATDGNVLKSSSIDIIESSEEETPSFCCNGAKISAYIKKLNDGVVNIKSNNQLCIADFYQQKSILQINAIFDHELSFFSYEYDDSNCMRTSFMIDEFVNSLKSVIPCALQLDSASILARISIIQKDATLYEFLAADGPRMSVSKIKSVITTPAEISKYINIPVIIGHEIISIYTRLINNNSNAFKDNPCIEVIKHKITNRLIFNFGNVYIRIDHDDEAPIAYERFIKKTSDMSFKIVVDRKTLLGVIERASVVTRDTKANVIRFCINKNKLTCESKSYLSENKFTESIPVESTGVQEEENLVININATYLIDLLKTFNADYNAVLWLNGNLEPVIITFAYNQKYYDDFWFLCMPCQIKDKPIES